MAGFRRDFVQARFSPRPRSMESIRKWGIEGSFDYIANTDGTLETRRGQVEVRTELENGDNFTVEYGNNYEFLDEEFEIADDIILPVAGYNFQNMRYSYRFGPQRSVSGWLSFQHGSFYSGNRKAINYWGQAIEKDPDTPLARLAQQRIDAAKERLKKAKKEVSK